jgi:hypothetical protein
MGTQNIPSWHETPEPTETWKDLIVLIAAFAFGYILGGMK